jgi:hypothetical protein
MLRDLQKNIESLYVNGQPLHHLPSARLVEFDPEASSEFSLIFVVDYAQFVQLDPLVIQDIFRKRHILITGIPYEKESFDEDSLSIFGDIDRPREITGASL